MCNDKQVSMDAARDPLTLIHFNHIRETANPTSVYTNQLHDRKLKFPTSASKGDLLQFPGWLLMSDVKTPECVEKALTRAKGFLHSRRDESCFIKSATFGCVLIFWCFSLSKCWWFFVRDVSHMLIIQSACLIHHLDRLTFRFVQTFMVSRGWILMTLDDPMTFS